MLSIIVALTCQQNEKKKKNTTKRIWAQEWLKKRFNAGIYQNLLQELRLQDQEHFRRYLRMNTDVFEVRKKSFFQKYASSH